MPASRDDRQRYVLRLRTKLLVASGSTSDAEREVAVAKVFVGHDWAEPRHHMYIEERKGGASQRPACPRASRGRPLPRAGATVVEDPAELVIATETVRGLFVGPWWLLGLPQYRGQPGQGGCPLTLPA